MSVLGYIMIAIYINTVWGLYKQVERTLRKKLYHFHSLPLPEANDNTLAQPD